MGPGWFPGPYLKQEKMIKKLSYLELQAVLKDVTAEKYKMASNVIGYKKNPRYKYLALLEAELTTAREDFIVSLYDAKEKKRLFELK